LSQLVTQRGFNDLHSSFKAASSSLLRAEVVGRRARRARTTMVAKKSDGPEKERQLSLTGLRIEHNIINSAETI